MPPLLLPLLLPLLPLLPPLLLPLLLPLLPPLLPPLLLPLLLDEEASAGWEPSPEAPPSSPVPTVAVAPPQATGGVSRARRKARRNRERRTRSFMVASPEHVSGQLRSARKSAASMGAPLRQRGGTRAFESRASMAPREWSSEGGKTWTAVLPTLQAKAKGL